MSDYEVKFNTVELLTAAEGAFQQTNELLGREFQKRITENRWGWPTGDSPRDIVDKGQLRDSYTPTRVSPTVFEHAWNTEYAMAVHEGAVMEPKTVEVGQHWRTISTAFGKPIPARSRQIRAHTRTTKTRVLPARPWVRVTLREVDVAGIYSKLAQAELAKVKDPPV